MRVVYSGPFEAVEIASIGQYAYPGVPLEVPDEVGRRLVMQGPWSDPDAPEQPDAVTPLVDEYDRWSPEQLREALANRQLSITGNPKALIKRLRDADAAPATDAAAELAGAEQTQES